MIYKLAAEGLIRFVRRNPNNISTYNEKDLLNHKFKHGAIARLLVAALEFAPFQQALSSTTRKTFTRGDVLMVLRRASARQWLYRTEMGSGGRPARELNEMMALLGRLDQLKNRGFYVGPDRSGVRRPNEIGRKDLEQTLELATVVINAAQVEVSGSYDPAQRREFMAQLKMLSAHRRRLLRRSRGKKAGTLAS